MNNSTLFALFFSLSLSLCALHEILWRRMHSLLLLLLTGRCSVHCGHLNGSIVIDVSVYASTVQLCVCLCVKKSAHFSRSSKTSENVQPVDSLIRPLAHFADDIVTLTVLLVNECMYCANCSMIISIYFLSLSFRFDVNEQHQLYSLFSPLLSIFEVKCILLYWQSPCDITLSLSPCASPARRTNRRISGTSLSLLFLLSFFLPLSLFFI